MRRLGAMGVGVLVAAAGSGAAGAAAWSGTAGAVVDKGATGSGASGTMGAGASGTGTAASGTTGAAASGTGAGASGTGAGASRTAAAAGARQHVRFRLLERRPNRVTGERFLIDYGNPQDPTGKPRVARRVAATIPRGARIDTSVPARCNASNADLKARGGAACPPASRVGRGSAKVDTGFAGPFRFVDANVEVFNTRGGFVALSTVARPPYREVMRFEIAGRNWRVTNPPLPGSPPDGAALDKLDIRIFAIRRGRGRKARNYITTPRRCPKRRYWRTKMRFTYTDGVTQDAWTRNPCRRRR